jgi:D-3-phosphoglycerate dehydrogenase
MKNILITTSTFAKQAPELLSTLEAAGLKVAVNPYGRKLAESEVDALIQEYRPVGMIAGVEPITRSIMGKAPFLKVISRCGIGMDSIDLEAAGELGITVTNTPDAPTIPVAELTIGLILTLLRSIHLSDASIRSGGWERPLGTLLHGKTVGIIGCGRIGSYLAKLLTSFDCNILGCDTTCNACDYYTLVELDTIFSQSDVVTLHIPYSPVNHHFINDARIKSMKRGAVLVNASRGGLVDELALVEALESGKLSGAAIDCFEEEPYSGPLSQLKNTLLTGHIGSYAEEGRMIMERQAVENLLKTLESFNVK